MCEHGRQVELETWGNYGPTIAHTTRAMEEKGCAQILWLFGDDHQVTKWGL